MPIRAEIYTAAGIAIGVVARTGHLRDALEAGETLRLEADDVACARQRAAARTGELNLPPDDIHIATGDEVDDFPVHAQWHDIALEVGPYRVRGQMPTMPGFDPGRALARPTGEFVQLRDVTIGLMDETEGGLTRAMALINRYVVDRVEADMMLGFFFPGATMVPTKPDEPVVVTSARRTPNGSADPAGSAGPTGAAPAHAGHVAGVLIALRSERPVAGAAPSRAGGTGPACDADEGRPAARGAAARPPSGPPRSGRGSTFRSGTKPSSTVHGIACRSRRWTPRSRSASSMETRLIASPVAPARPVRPIRWM